MKPQKIKTFLWFDNKAQEAAEFYCTLFPNSRITRIIPAQQNDPSDSNQAEPKAFVVEFELAHVQFVALNGGPMFQFSEAISLSVDCENQDEVDFLWDKLTAQGQPGHCGWLKDPFGVSWQIVPNALMGLLFTGSSARRQRVMDCMLQMAKLDIKELEKAAESSSE